VEAFATQLRRVLSDQAEWLAKIRRDAEAMWRANPPTGYGTFEAWWRHLRTTGPFAEIQEHLEKAAVLTFQLEARYRRNRHEIPAARQAVAQAKQAPALTPGRGSAARQPRSEGQPADPPAGDFMDLIRAKGGRKRSA
jgi:hypothetical protein